MSNTSTDAALEEATFQRLLEISSALDETVQAINTISGALELGRRELERQAAELRELSPGILPGRENTGIG